MERSHRCSLGENGFILIHNFRSCPSTMAGKAQRGCGPVFGGDFSTSRCIRKQRKFNQKQGQPITFDALPRTTQPGSHPQTCYQLQTWSLTHIKTVRNVSYLNHNTNLLMTILKLGSTYTRRFKPPSSLLYFLIWLLI